MAVECPAGTACNSIDDCTACITPNTTCEKQGDCGAHVRCEEGASCKSTDGGTPGAPVCINACEAPPLPPVRPVCLEGAVWDGKSECVAPQPCAPDPRTHIRCPAGDDAASRRNGGGRCAYSCRARDAHATAGLVGGARAMNAEGGTAAVQCARDLRRLPWCDQPGLMDDGWACCVSDAGDCGKHRHAGQVLADTGGAQVERLAICANAQAEEEAARASRCQPPPGDYQSSCTALRLSDNVDDDGTCTLSARCEKDASGAGRPTSITYRADSAEQHYYVVNDRGALSDEPPFGCADVAGPYTGSCTDITSKPNFATKTCELTAKCANASGGVVDAKFVFDAPKAGELSLFNNDGHLSAKPPLKCRAYGGYASSCTDVKVLADAQTGECVVEAKCLDRSGRPVAASYSYDPKVESGVFLHNDDGALVNLASTGGIFRCEPIGSYRTSNLCTDMTTVTKYDTSDPKQVKLRTTCEVDGRCKADGSAAAPYVDVHFEYPYPKENETYIEASQGALRHNPPWSCPTPLVDASADCRNGRVRPNYRAADEDKECAYEASCAASPSGRRQSATKFYSHAARPRLVSHLGLLVDETERPAGVT